MARAPKQPKSIIYGAAPSADKPSQGNRLREKDAKALEHGAKSARILASIRRDMDLKDVLFRRRIRNEEVLALSYADGLQIGGADETENLRENSLNLPYRHVRWIESQATSKKMVVKVNRDAGAGQRPSGPSDSATGMWLGKCLERVAYIAGFNREIKAVIGEVEPRGTSVMRIGYHEEAITLAQAAEVGKDAQSVIPEVLAEGDVEAKPGQAHAEISHGLANMAKDPMVQMAVGREGVAAMLERKDSHDIADFKDETNEAPSESTRLIRRRIWMRKLRVGEQVGWSPHACDIEDSPMWWARHVDPVAWVKSSPLFSKAFRDKCGDYAMDGRTVSMVASGGKMPSEQSMGADARQAQSEDVLDDDERMVEWFEVWIRRPDMKSGGVRKIVCAACPDEFVESDDSNPHVHTSGPMRGFGLIPGFFPFYDFTPIKSSLMTPESTCGVPPIAVGMPHFEKMTELRRLTHESALRHSLRLYQKHPGLKDDKKINDALKNGTDGFTYDCPPGAVGSDGKMEQAILPIQFSGNTLEVDRQIGEERSAWVMVMGMPPAVLQGMGTAQTAAQDNMGLAAGERESGALVGYFEERMGDVLSGIRGLMRGNYDDEDFIALLGEDGAKVMKEWQEGTVDDGDMIEVTFGANAQAERTVRTKQLMEAITILKAEIDPVTMMPKYDVTPLLDELCRMLDVGEPQLDAGMLKQLQQLAMLGKQALQLTQGAKQGKEGQTPGDKPPQNGSAPRAGPNPSEGNGPKEGTLAAGAVRGTKMLGMASL